MMTNTAIELNKTDTPTTASLVTTGDRDKRMHLYYQLIHSMKNARRIDIIVSFLMESGVKMLLKDLERAMDRGTEVRILTGTLLEIGRGEREAQSVLQILQTGRRADAGFTDIRKDDYSKVPTMFTVSTATSAWLNSISTSPDEDSRNTPRSGNG